MFQWLIVFLYVAAMFLFAGDEISSSTRMSKLLAKWLPQLKSVEIKQWVVVIRKLGHVLAYGVLTLIVYLAAYKTTRLRKKALPFAITFALIFAIIDESYQRALVHRTGSWKDVFIDGIGIAAVSLGVLWRNRQKKKTDMEVMEDIENELV